MQFTPVVEIPEIIMIEPPLFRDQRGSFMETYHQPRFEEAGIGVEFVQDNHSRSATRVLRGLHYQHPTGQGKLVRVSRGEIFDVAVDIRVGSPTFGRWIGAYLSEENRRQLYIPPGFAHGFVVTRGDADVIYKCTEIYTPQDESVLAWDDPTVGIRWPIDEPIISAKDREGSTLHELERAGRLPNYRLPEVRSTAGT